MPKKKKPLTELPDQKAIERLFPKRVVEEAKKVAHEKDDKRGRKPKKHK